MSLTETAEILLICIIEKHRFDYTAVVKPTDGLRTANKFTTYFTIIKEKGGSTTSLLLLFNC
jgi:hypothetical protein